MRKGVFFTMDAAFALYISLLVMSTLMIILEASTNYSNDPTVLMRLAQDVYEVKSYDPAARLPSFIKTDIDCNSAEDIGSVQKFVYSDIGVDDSWTTKAGVYVTSQKVCYG